MSTVKQEKAARTLKEHLGQLFQEQSASLFNGAFITVTAVEVAPDLTEAKVYLSLFVPNDKEKVFRMIEDQKGTIRKLLGKKIRNKLQKMPRFTFALDHSAEQADRIDQLLKRDRKNQDDQEH